MAFNIGNIFSPEMLRMVDAEKERRTRTGQNNLALQAQLYRGHEEDKFKYAQMRAAEAGNNADRASRERVSKDTRDQRAELNDANLNFKSAMLENKALSADAALNEKRRQFDEMFPVSKQKADAQTTRAGASVTNAGARADQVGLNREIQFGPGDASNPGEGSQAAVRSSEVGKNSAQTDYLGKQAEAMTQKIAGLMPEQINDKRRTAVLEAAQDLHERMFRVRTTQDAEKIAIDLVKALRNPITGSFNDADMAKVSSAMSGQIFGMMNSFDAKIAKAFADQFQKSSAEGLNSDVDKAAKDAGTRNPTPQTNDERLKQTQDTLEKMRQKARDDLTGKAPNSVGR